MGSILIAVIYVKIGCVTYRLKSLSLYLHHFDVKSKLLCFLEWVYHYIVSSLRYKFDFPLIYGEDAVK